MLDPKYLAEIKAREQAATPGPWKHEEENSEYVIGPNELNVCLIYRKDLGDAAFIANARTDIPALVAEVERLKNCKCVDKCGLVCLLGKYDAMKAERDTLKRTLEIVFTEFGRYLPHDMDFYIHQAQEQEGKK